MKVQISIKPDGSLFFVHDDNLAALLSEGDARIVRASNVEPNPDTLQWEADLAPIHGPLLTGFASRGEALAAEVQWLNQNLTRLQLPQV